MAPGISRVAPRPREARIDKRSGRRVPGLEVDGVDEAAGFHAIEHDREDPSLFRRRGSIDRLEPSVVSCLSDLLAAPCVIRDEVLECESNGLTCIRVGQVGDSR
jgi:hypothetical protein